MWKIETCQVFHATILSHPTKMCDKSTKNYPTSNQCQLYAQKTPP